MCDDELCVSIKHFDIPARWRTFSKPARCCPCFFSPRLRKSRTSSAATIDRMFSRGQPDAASRPDRSVEEGRPLGTDRDENDVSLGWARSFSFAGTVVIVGFLLVFLRSILVPLVVALFLAYLVRPLAESISTCRCIPYFRKRQEAKRREEERGDEENEPLLGGEVPPSERLANDSRQLIETLLPRWVGVILALILALGVIVGILG